MHAYHSKRIWQKMNLCLYNRYVSTTTALLATLSKSIAACTHVERDWTYSAIVSKQITAVRIVTRRADKQGSSH
jgi:hypothetical protein